MGSSARLRSAHMVDIKGKGILYEDDDAPIKLTDDDNSQAIEEHCMSLIGKVLVPKKQNVEKLLQTMPIQWGMQDRISANDLGNGKFLFNFCSEDDLNHVLRQGPFHYNFCMFVLVCWEPIVHDDYPWIIPFWVQLIGIPLHLWTIKNLKTIGYRLEHVNEDSIELNQGRMLIDIDSRLPLKFKRQVEAPEGGEVTMEIKYEKLFKHFSVCGLMTHEKGHCLSVESSNQQVAERGGVFARVQVPSDRQGHVMQGNLHNNTQHDRRPVLGSGRIDDGRRDTVRPYGEHTSARSSYSNNGRHLDIVHDTARFISDNSSSHSSHKDRIIRGRDDHKRNRYGGSRYAATPYARRSELMWREKPREERKHEKAETMVSERKQDVPYEHSKKTEDHSMIVSDSHSIDNQRSNGKTKRLASAIVTPSRITTGQEENVTLRNKEVSCLLSFSPSSFQVHENGNDNDQIIEALNDMEIVEQYDGGMMECDVQDDDLLGEDLMTMEEVKQPVSGPSTMKVHSGEKKERSQRVQSHKRGRSMNVTLGIQSKKATFLRRGSPRPRLRSRSARSPELRSQRHGLKKVRKSSGKSDGLMSSINSSYHHL
ncbi:hypothetical protein Bca4012_026865 [Brassica carinata]